MISESTEDSFYITLTSNASINTFPHNIPSHFTNILNNSVHLDNSNSKWCVSLSEIHIPLTCYNVTNEQNIIWYELSDIDKRKYKIPPGYYQSTEQLLEELNNATPLIQFSFSNFIEIKCSKEIKKVYLSSLLALQLGFQPMVDVVKLKKGIRQPNLDIGYPQQIFVYTDIIDHQFVGDAKAPLLRIVSISDINHGKVQTVTFQNMHYIPLSKLVFDTIEVLLKDHTGRDLPFAFGTLTITLHFKRSSTST